MRKRSVPTIVTVTLHETETSAVNEKPLAQKRIEPGLHIETLPNFDMSDSDTAKITSSPSEQILAPIPDSMEEL